MNRMLKLSIYIVAQMGFALNIAVSAPLSGVGPVEEQVDFIVEEKTEEAVLEKTCKEPNAGFDYQNAQNPACNAQSHHDKAMRYFVENELDLVGYKVEDSIAFAACHTNNPDIQDCELVYFGEFSFLCQERRRNISFQRGLKKVVTGLISLAIPLPTILYAISMGAGAFSTKIEIEEQYKLWKSSCLNEAETKFEDDFVKGLWAISNLSDHEPFIVQNGAKELYSELTNLTKNFSFDVSRVYQTEGNFAFDMENEDFIFGEHTPGEWKTAGESDEDEMELTPHERMMLETGYEGSLQLEEESKKDDAPNVKPEPSIANDIINRLGGNS